jgi:invasion protein IalB
MQKQYVLIALTMSLCSILYAQPLVEWARNFGGTAADVGLSIVPTSDGGYIAFGQTNSNNGNFPISLGLADFGVLKVNASGIVQWSRKFGGNHVDNGIFVHPTSDGGFILCGSTKSDNGDFLVNKGNFDIGVVKIDANGNKQWSNTYGGSGEDNPFCIKQAADGGYILCGLSSSNDGDFSQHNGGFYDYSVVKLNSSGGLEWARNFGGAGDDQAKSVETTSDGGFIICGASSSASGDFNQNNGSFDYGVIKISNAGIRQWAVNYGGTSSDKANCIKQTNDGGYIVIGESASVNGTFSQTNGGMDIGVVKIAAMGSVEWARNYGGNFFDSGVFINTTLDGNYVLLASSLSPNGDFAQANGQQDYGVIKINTAGTKIWARNYGGGGIDIPAAIFPTTDGGYIINGYSDSSDGDFSQHNGVGDYGIMKLSGVDCSTLNINITATPTASTCTTSRDGKITLNTNVSTIKSFQWSSSISTTGVGNNNVVTNLDPASYNVTVTLQNGCTAIANNVLIGSGNSTLTATPIPPSCLGSTNGRILLSAPPTGIQLYVWSNGVTIGSASGANINNLTAGTYNITVNLTNNCVAFANNVILQPGVQHSITATPTAPLCSGNNGTININSDGTILSYFWMRGLQSGGGAGGNLGSLSAGTYQITVTHSTGCKSNTTVTIPSTPPITSSASASPPFCQGQNDGSITLISSETIASFAWSGANSNGTGTGTTINNLAAGTYTITITHANTCTTIVTATVAQGVTVPLTALPNIPTCANLSDGSIALSASSAITSFIWNNGTITNNGIGATMTNLATGSYNITATLANGCIAIGNATITPAQAPTLIGSPTKPSCLGKTDASIALSANQPINNFIWSSGNATNNGIGGSINNLAPGNYSITATLANGCITKTTVLIQAGDAPQINAAITPPSCGGKNDAAVSLSSNAGAVVNYNWTRGALNNSGTGSTITALSTGVYFITVTLDNGCTGTQIVNILPGATPPLNVTPTRPTCLGKDDASLMLSSTDAIATYVWAGNSTSGSGTGATITNLKAGTYAVTATLANGCLTTTIITIQAGSQTIASGNPIAPSCLGKDDGSINLLAVEPISAYSWEKIPSGIGNGIGSLIDNLNAGTYNISLTLSNGCLATTTVTIPPPQALNLNAIPTKPSCFGNNDGIINLGATQGIASFQWFGNAKNGNGIGNQITGLSQGSYNITATLNNGCFAIANNILIEAGINIPLATSPSAPSCLGGKDGSIALNANNTITNYAWTSSNGSFFGTSNNINNIAAGVYNITATLANGCLAVASNIIVPFGTPLSLTALPQSPSCLGRNDGRIQLNAVANIATFTWSGGGNTKNGNGSNINTLPSGTYSISATLTNGCIANVSNVIIPNGTPIQANITTTAPTCLGKNDGKVTILNMPQATNYNWSNGVTTGNGQSNIVSNLASGIYQITATLSDKCIAIAKDIKVEDGQIYALSVTAVHPTCAGKDGSLALAVQNQTIQNFQWQSGANVGNGNHASINNLSSGNYNITATLSNGCISIGTAKLNTPINATINLIALSPTCPKGNDGKITLDALSNSITAYTWSNGVITKNGNNTTIDSLTAGEYSISITLSNGCEVVNTIKVEDLAAFIIAPSITPSSCSGNDGKIFLTGNGFSVTNYQWVSGSDQKVGNGNTMEGLKEGEYTITTTLSNGCFSTITLTVPLDNIFTLSANTTPPSCESKDDGTIVLNSQYEIEKYSWAKDTLTGTSLTYLSSGIYAITVTSKGGCETVLNNVIIPKGKIFSVNAVTISPSCAGKADATIILNGSSPITSYNWITKNGNMGTSLNNLLAGTYDITVTSSTGCEAILKDILISDGASFVVSATTTTPSCDDKADGAIALLSANDISYYTWETGSQKGSDLNNLKSGNYTITITSINGCDVVLNNVVIPKGVVFDLNVTTVSPKCYGEMGAILLSSNQPNAISYEWNNGNTTGSGNNLMIPSLIAGTYDITVALNGTGCIKTQKIQLVEPLPLTLSMIKNNTSCKGNDGAIEVKTNGGTPPYQYQWNDGYADAQRKNLKAGAYSITLTDANGCNSSQTTTIQSINTSYNAIDTLVCEGQAIQIGTKKFNKEGQYTETLLNSKGCDSIVTLNLRIDKIVLDLGNNIEICPNETVELKANTNCTNCQLRWNEGSTSSKLKVTPDKTSTYSLILTNNKGCTVKDEITVLIKNIATFAANDDAFLLANGEAMVFNIAQNDNFSKIEDFEWKVSRQAKSGTAIIQNSNQILFSPSTQFKDFSIDTFAYQLCYRACPLRCDSANAVLRYQKEECSREVFNGLTAELNGQNNSFTPLEDLQQNGCDVNKNTARLKIANPWGDVIFKPSSYQAWYPTRSGNEGDATLPAGTYYYILEVAINGKKEILKGSIVVLE